MIKIAIVGDYDECRPAHIATNEAITHVRSVLPFDFEVHWVATPQIEDSRHLQELKGYDGIWGSAGDPDNSIGLIRAIEFARLHNIAYLGT